MTGWLSRLGNVFVAILLIPLLPLLIVIIPLLNWLGWNKSGAGPEYVIDRLEGFIAGTEAAYDWDDLCTIPLKNLELDAIRERACQFAPPNPFGERELEKLQGLLEEAKAIACPKR